MFAENENLNIIKMKKQILNIGKSLNKAEQKEVIGGDYWIVIGGPFQGIEPINGTGQPGGPGLGSGPTGPECAVDDDCCHYQHTSGIGYVCSSGVCAPGLSPNPFCGL